MGPVSFFLSSHSQLYQPGTGCLGHPKKLWTPRGPLWVWTLWTWGQLNNELALFPIENLGYLGVLYVCFMKNSLVCLWMTTFWQLVCPKQFFSACDKGAFFRIIFFLEKCLTLQGCAVLCPNHLTDTDSWRINWKIFCISFIWLYSIIFVPLLVRQPSPLEKVASSWQPSHCSFLSWVIKLSLI